MTYFFLLGISFPLLLILCFSQRAFISQSSLVTYTRILELDCLNLDPLPTSHQLHHMGKSFFPLKKLVVVKYTILITSKCTIQWHQIYSQYCAIITTIHVQNFSSSQPKILYSLSTNSPLYLIPPYPGPGNHYSMSMNLPNFRYLI